MAGGWLSFEIYDFLKSIPTSVPEFIMEKSDKLHSLKNNCLEGRGVTREEALWLLANIPTDELCDAAGEIARKWCGDTVDSCSIVNARSGLCSEDCKWCAQSARHHTGCETYNIIDEDDMMRAARHNEREGIRRFSLVTSGRSIKSADIDKFCALVSKLKENTDLDICVSMGLLGEEELAKLYDAGVRRYHCNMETSEEFFKTLCTTHTPEDKRKTINAARKVGMEVCSGGIIGMGETMEQRVDFAFELAELDVDSVPVNILNPIPGTPLESQPLISTDEVARTVAIFRFILPRKAIRFAGGRMRLSHKDMLRIMTGGMSGVLMGDMLTTVSNTIADDRRLFAEANLKF